MSPFVVVLIVTVLVMVNALYVAAEFASVKVRKTRILERATSGNALAQRLLPLIAEGKPIDDYVAACQIGITISSLTLGAYGQRVLAARLADPIARALPALGLDIDPGLATEGLAASIAVWGVLILITTLQVILGELLPKSISVQYPERMSLATYVPMRISLSLFRPFIWFFNGSGQIILRALGYDHHGHVVAHSLKEIEILVAASTEGGLLEAEERQMLRNTLRLRDLTARQVMVHRTRLVAAPIQAPVAEVLALCMEAGNTRIPLYRDSIDQIEGIVHIKDLYRLFLQGETDTSAVRRDAVYVPESLPVAEVWETLSHTNQYMVIVFDEYGGTAGLITLEDLIEEVFGELQDEFDQEEQILVEDEHGRYHLRGDLLISDVNEYLRLSFPEEEADTLSGLILTTLGRAPYEGEEVAIDGTLVRVEKMVDLGVAEISLEKPAIELSRIPEWEAVDASDDEETEDGDVAGAGTGAADPGAP